MNEELKLIKTKMTNSYELISDLHKDATGCRPSFDWLKNFHAGTDAEKDSTWKSLCDILAANEVLGAEQDAACLEVFESHLADLMTHHSVDLLTAIKWDMQAHGSDVKKAREEFHDDTQEIEQYLWAQGLAFKVWPKYVELAKQITF